MSRLFSIEPVGILNACTTNVRMNSARITAITIDSKYSRPVDFLKSPVTRCRPFLRRVGTNPDALLLGAHLQDGQEGFLRNLHAADALHALLAFLLFLEQ